MSELRKCRSWLGCRTLVNKPYRFCARHQPNRFGEDELMKEKKLSENNEIGAHPIFRKKI